MYNKVVEAFRLVFMDIDRNCGVYTCIWHDTGSFSRKNNLLIHESIALNSFTASPPLQTILSCPERHTTKTKPLPRNIF